MRIVLAILALALVAGCGGGGGLVGTGTPEAVPPFEEAVRERALGQGWSLMERSLAAGRWLVFHTPQALVPEDVNGTYDVYLQDLETDAVTRISAGNRASFYASLSADGNRVVYASDATDLVPGDTNGRRDVFLHDRQAGTTVRVSVDASGHQGTGTSTTPALSADGNLVVFPSDARLVPQKTTSTIDLFVRDVAAGTTTLLAAGNGACSTPAVSADGRYVAFVSTSTNLVPGDTNGAADVFLLDRQAGALERVSTGPAGVQANGACSQPSLSDDGRYVAFDSLARNLVAGDANLRRDVFLRDRSDGSTASPTVTGNGDSSQPTLARDGTKLAFTSLASNLAAGTGSVYWQVLGGALHRVDGTDQAVWDSGNGTLAWRGGAQAQAEQLVPDAPAGLQATPGDGSATLTWSASAGADSYEVSVGGQPHSTSSITSATVGGLANGTSYTFTVRAHGEAGWSAPSAAATATPFRPGPAAPTGVTATPGDGQASLAWTAVSGAVTYRVHLQGNPTPSATSSTASVAVTGLNNNQSYTFVVYAVDSLGAVSPASSPVSVTPVGPGGTLWAARLGGLDTDFAHDSALGPDGTLYLCGSFRGSVAFGSTTLVSDGLGDGFVAAVNPATGAVLWAVRGGGASNDEALGLAVTSSAVYVTGYYHGAMTGFGQQAGAPAGGSDVFVASLNPATGAASWCKRAGGTGSDEGLAVAATSTAVFVTGFYNGTSTGFASSLPASAGAGDVFVVSLNPSGSTNWTLRGGSTGDDVGRGIAVTSTGLFVAGNYSGTPNGFLSAAGASAGGQDGFAAGIVPATGSSTWVKRMGGTSSEQALAVDADASGVYVVGYYLAGTGAPTGFATPGPCVGGADAYAAALNPSNGNTIWSAGSGSTDNEFARGVAVSGSRVYVVGSCSLGTPSGFLSAAGAGAGSDDAFAAGLNAGTGASVWARRSGGPGNQHARGAAAGSSAVYAVGYYESTMAPGFAAAAGAPAGTYDLFMARLAP